jgi:hypothetical protein
MGKIPENGQAVEILVNGEWVTARFLASDSIASDPGEDEIWWCDHFVLANHWTVPDDTQAFHPLPEWRPKQ